MNYKIVENDDKSLYHVKETSTGYIIKSFSVFLEAKKYMKFLNMGGSFDGFTPSFILNNTAKICSAPRAQAARATIEGQRNSRG